MFLVNSKRVIYYARSSHARTYSTVLLALSGSTSALNNYWLLSVHSSLLLIFRIIIPMAPWSDCLNNDCAHFEVLLRWERMSKVQWYDWLHMIWYSSSIHPILSTHPHQYWYCSSPIISLCWISYYDHRSHHYYFGLFSSVLTASCWNSLLPVPGIQSNSICMHWIVECTPHYWPKTCHSPLAFGLKSACPWRH